MTRQLDTVLAHGKARIVAAPVTPTASAATAAPLLRNAPRHQVEIDRNFGLPTQFYGATVALYLAFVGVMFATFNTPELVIPMVIFALFIVAGFGVPALWVRLKNNDSAAMSQARFKADGIMTHTGRLAPRDAAIQMLILPSLIVVWSVAIAIIAASV